MKTLKKCIAAFIVLASFFSLLKGYHLIKSPDNTTEITTIAETTDCRSYQNQSKA